MSSNTDIKGLVWTIAFGYTLNQTAKSQLDAFVGARYFGIDMVTNWALSAAITTPDDTVALPREGSIGNDTDLWDAIVGLRGEFGLGDGQSRWSVPYYIDVGTGSSDLTWNAMAGVAYEFNWGDLMLIYRHLEYDEGSSGLLQGFSFGGPAFGARFKF